MVFSIISINLFLTPSPAVAQDATTLTQTESRLIEMAARKRGLRPSDLEVLASSSMKLPLTRGRVHVAKLLNRATGEVYSVAMNAAGQEEEPEKLRAAEAQAPTST
jgi:hypothetical protein